MAPRLPNFEVRDRVLSFVGPAAIVFLFVLWLALILLGISMIIWWNSGVTFADALAVAGSSVTTLGIATTPGGGPRTLEIVAAGIGFGVIALEIAYLPALYIAVRHPGDRGDPAPARGGTPAWGPRSWPATSGFAPWTSSRRSTPTGSAGRPRSPRATPTTRR